MHILSFRLWIALFAILLAIAYWIFSQGLQGGLHFDDSANLGGLSEIKSIESVFDFIFGGISGPVGRPLSLLSFALQADSWPNFPQHLILANILIHLLNAILVGWFALLLARRTNTKQKELFAFIISAIWLLHPIQVSPVLFIVQRMTLLAGSFTLLGLIFYLLGRSPGNTAKATLGWITLSFAMTLPALLCKENGALLPGFLLILEFFILRSNIGAPSNRKPTSTPPHENKLYTWTLVSWALSIWVIGLIGLIYYWPIFTNTTLAKSYTMLQHGATEIRALAHYIQQIVIPHAKYLGPFHDDFYVSSNWHDWRVLISGALLIALALLAWLLRHRIPIASAGIFFYLWGHALESTLIPLEPYFEHRNYVPLLGFSMALTAISLSFEAYKKYALLGVFGFFIMCVISTYQYTSLWGDRQLSAYIWHLERPKSTRATLHLADFLATQQQWSDMYQVVHTAWRSNPEDINLAISTLYCACRTHAKEIEKNMLQEIIQLARTSPFKIQSITTLDQITEQVTSSNCAAIPHEDILKILDAFGENAYYKIHAKTNADLLTIRSKLAFSRGEVLESATLLDAAVTQNFRIDLAIQAAIMFASIGQVEKANYLLIKSRTHLSNNKWLERKWIQKVLDTELSIAKHPRGLRN